jgi:NADH dehydrogenase (ubiquinone) 1 alpha subcomplex subunit 1
VPNSPWPKKPKKNSLLQPIESLPPFAIIVAAITAMGGVQYLVHHAYEGKPKPVGFDNFDRLLKYRDLRLKDEAKVRNWVTSDSGHTQTYFSK